MPDLKLAPLLEASQPAQLQPALDPFFGPDASPPKIEATRLHLPTCYWAVYRGGPRRVTLKSFFSADHYTHYAAQLTRLYPDRLEQPEHPRGGLLLVPELNGVLWALPFDPTMTALHRCFDGAWIANALRRPSAQVRPELLRYNPEVGALFAYHSRGRIIAYGKATPRDASGRIYVVMNRLWRSPARRGGRLRLARPLAFRPQAGLLLQAPVRGKPLRGERNTARFLDLATTAGHALAAIHAADLPFGPHRQLAQLVARLHDALDNLALTAPPLHGTLRRLLSQMEARARRSQAGPPVPSHGDFKWDQFLEHRGRFSLIDFELFCQAEPAFDVGYFCAYLPPTSPRDWRDGAAAEMLRAAFLQTYATATGTQVDLARVALYESSMLAIRALSHVWRQRSNWLVRASQLLDLALERLVNPEPGQLDWGA